MSDDLNKKIKQITDILGQETVPDNLKGLLSLFTSSVSKEDSSPAKQQPVKEEQPRLLNEDKSSRSDMEENVEMMRRIKNIMDRVSSNNDPRVNLLTAIKPFLRNSRQKSLNTCIKLLNITSLSTLMDDMDKENF